MTRKLTDEQWIYLSCESCKLGQKGKCKPEYLMEFKMSMPTECKRRKVNYIVRNPVKNKHENL